MSAEKKVQDAVLAAVADVQAAADMLRPLVGLEDAYPQLVYDRSKALASATGKLEGLRLALELIRKEQP